MKDDGVHYDPEGKPQRLSVRAKVPRASLGLNKRAIILLGGTIALIVGIVFLGALSPKEKQEAYRADNKWNPHPGEAIQGLPNDYDELKRRKEEKKIYEAPKEIEKPLKGAPEKKLSIEEQLLAEYEVTRLKEAIKARSSDVEFIGLKARLESLQNSTRLTRGETAGSSGQNASGIEGGIYNPRDEDNRQDEKEAFLNTRPDPNTHLSSRLKSPESRYQLMAGTMIPGLMLSGVNSDLPGNIVGQVSQNVYDTVSGRYLLLPQGAKVIGLYDSKITYGQERVLIVWNRIIFPNGDSMSLEGMPGVDMSGYAGLKDKVNNHYFRLLTGVVLGSLLGAGSQMAYGNYQNVNPDFGQLAVQGAAQNLNQAGQRITQKNLNIQPTLEIRPGLRFNIFVTKDVGLQPYRG